MHAEVKATLRMAEERLAAARAERQRLVRLEDRAHDAAAGGDAEAVVALQAAKAATAAAGAEVRAAAAALEAALNA